MIITVLLTIFFTLTLYIYQWARRQKNFWKDRGVPYIDSPLLLGHFLRPMILKESPAVTVSRLYNHRNAKGQPFVGVHLFHKPTILLRDPDLIKKIMIKDFNSFSQRHTGADPEVDPIAAKSLFQVKNPPWRTIRTKLSPVFTSCKIKQMLYMVNQVSNEMMDVIKTKTEAGDSEFDISTLLAMYFVDSISLVAFGTNSNCLKDPSNSEFLRNTSKAFQATWWDKISGNFMFYLPVVMKQLRMKTFNSDFNHFLRRLFTEVVNDRHGKGLVRHDLIDALIGFRNEVFTDDCLTAQAAAFFVAGFETSRASMEFVLYELAKRQEVQNKVRQEIKRALQEYGGEITYEMVMQGIPFTVSVVNEIQRLYPVVPFLDRECNAPEGYLLEAGQYKVHLPYGTPIYIPAFALHHDSDLFPDPETFNPTRFDPVNGTSGNEYAYLPFGIGPRNCIGERFAVMQMRVVIVRILGLYRLDLTQDAREQLTFDKTSFLLRSDKKIVLKFVPDTI